MVTIPHKNLGALTYSNHYYDDIENVLLRDPPSTSAVDGIKTVVCPVSLSTMYQNQPPTDADDYEPVLYEEMGALCGTSIV